MKLAPLARILLRYGTGFFAGATFGQGLAQDPDLVLLTSLALGALIEGAYLLARRFGGAT